MYQFIAFISALLLALLILAETKFGTVPDLAIQLAFGSALIFFLLHLMKKYKR
ncbi:hypothetical protein [Bacillus marinisedimentorum]|uniref:hypothetical protein n=1 Tax=Bacillus marinisedimentorum TaxID=1821260 RepID=UPI001471A253|nr:hypothetical protein [Bacillus marinisedimentorum]